MARKAKTGLIANVLNEPWAIMPDKLLEIREIYITHTRNEKIDIAAIEARLGQPLDNQRQPYEVHDGVAVISADGVIAKKMNLFSEISGGVSTQLLEKDIQTALDDPSVHSLVLSMDSPGGTVDGTFELAQSIAAARGRKPMVAFADGMMGSAAYLIGSAMDKVFMSGSAAQIGSIGVVATHIDRSKQDESRGLKVTEITSGKYKRIASEHAPLTVEGRADIQEKTDYLYSLFVDNVAKNRGVSVKTVLDRMADGQVFIGKQGVDAGLADGITTLPALISQLNQQHSSTNSQEATMDEKEKKALEQAAFDKGKLEGIAEGKALGITEGKAAGLAEGAKVERERIQAVETQSVVGQEELIAKLKFDGKTTGPEAAVQVLAAVKAKNAGKLKDILTDAPKPAVHSEAPAAEPKTDDDKDQNPAAVGAEIAEEAVTYKNEQAKLGKNITTAQAVRHIEKQRAKQPAA